MCIRPFIMIGDDAAAAAEDCDKANVITADRDNSNLSMPAYRKQY